MESAIPESLRTEPTKARTMNAGYVPPYPAWTTRFAADVKQVVMAYFGIQSKQKLNIDSLEPFTYRFIGDDAPEYWVPAYEQDAKGYHNLITIGYWADVTTFHRWAKQSSFFEWWHDNERETENIGYFLEIYYPEIGQFETIFSVQNAPEGIAHLAVSMSDEIQEHGYYGSMRDRLPCAQIDDLNHEQSSVGSCTSQSRTRIKLQGRKNLCLIRSGQDWSYTQDKERRLYLAQVEPVLQKGMLFLRDEGSAEGCINCRYMTVLDKDTGQPTERTFGLAQFIDLEHLEAWAKSHPTHVEIFGQFMNYVQTMNYQINLRLFHEVIVVPEQSQYFEYINCHAQTGLLKYK